MTIDNPPARIETQPDSSHDAKPPREMTSEQLFEGAREVLIRHAGEVYRLRLTRNGKLILHK